MEYIGHKVGANTQALIDHLRDTAELAQRYGNRLSAETGNLAYLLGLMHDIGKYSDAFQYHIKNETAEKVNHAYAGGVEMMYMQRLYNNQCNVQVRNINNMLLGALICGHHAGVPDILSDAWKKSYAQILAESKKLPPYGNYHVEVDKLLRHNIALPQQLQKGISRMLLLKNEEQDASVLELNKWRYDIMSYYRYLYACMVDADYLNTEQYMVGAGAQTRYGQARQEHYMATLPQLYIRYAQYYADNIHNGKSKNAINQKRTEMLQKCEEAAKNNPHHIIELPIPTGGGKTLASISMAMQLAKSKKLDRIIYVIPYTSILEQTAEVLSGIFGAENVLAHYGNADYKLHKQQAYAAENWDAPIIVTTTVQLFESLHHNRSTMTRKLHNIVNAVIVCDEIQILPTGVLLPCAQALRVLAEYYNNYVILCTATQPCMDMMINYYSDRLPHINKTPITTVMEQDIESNYNYFMRNRIYWQQTIQTEEKIAKAMSATNQALCICNTKATAYDIYGVLMAEKLPHKLYCLTTNMCPAHRQRAFAKIKQQLKSGEKVLVVSTSLMEVGVDLDFQCVWREINRLDAILQAAGRCNREMRLAPKDAVVTVFQLPQTCKSNAQGKSMIASELDNHINATKIIFEKLLADKQSIGKWGYKIQSYEVVQEWYKLVYTTAKVGNYEKYFDKYEVLSGGIKGDYDYTTVAAQYKIIDDKNVYNVIIPTADNQSLIIELQNGEYSKEILRKLSKTMVNIKKPNAKKQEQYDMILEPTPIQDMYVLKDLNMYDKKIGLWI